jgi:tetratricopeptide (TPR) repeat protein
LLWFDGANYRLVSQEDIRDEDKVDADYFVRSIIQSTASGKYDDAAAAAKLALEQFAGEPILLSTISSLLSGDKVGICEAIIDEHLNQRPGDPKALLCKAELLLHNFRINTPPQAELVKESEQLVDRALSTSGRKDWQEAELLRCDIARLSAEDAEKVEGLYKTCVEKFPGFAAARFGLALHYLNSDPEKALAEFAAGEKLRPNDLNFPLGQAQALIRSARLDQAVAAIDRARLLNPTHPLLRILTDEIESARSKISVNQEPRTLH